MYYICTHDLTQTVDGNVSQSPDKILNSQKEHRITHFNEENSIQLPSDSDNPSLIFNDHY